MIHIMNRLRSLHKLYPLFLVLLFLGLLASCKKDDDNSTIIDNRQFHELMKEWYFWYKEMPNINPDNYPSVHHVLEALRYKSLDRWSFITTKQEIEAYYQESKFIGHGFGSSYDNQGKLRISFVFNSVPLFQQGVRRSWIIHSINGTIIAGQSISQLLGPNNIGVSNTFVFQKPDGTLTSPITVVKDEVIMNNVLHSEVINTPAGKAGYIVFQGFTNPAVEELRQNFQTFLSEGVSDLILDLRYNGGGATSVANYLASSILSASNKGDVFFKYRFNDKKASENESDVFRETENNLGIPRLFVIATKGTASASELIINGLKPYIDVYVVGGDTHGKPTGMLAWTYKDYAFVPVTFETVNANDEGAYYNGIPVDGPAEDDLSRGFGNPEESSLKEALHYIVNGSFSGIPGTKSQVYYKQSWEEFSGLRAIIMSH